LYQSRTPPYRAKNAPFETVEELLLVHGMTPGYLYGVPRQAQDRAFTSEPYRRIGLFPYVTVWDAQRNVAPDGTRRVNLQARQPLQRLLRDRLGQPRTAEIVALLPSR